MNITVSDIVDFSIEKKWFDGTVPEVPTHASNIGDTVVDSRG